MYKFISYKEYETSYKSNYPNARISPDKTVVVLSVNTPDKDCVSWEEASKTVGAWEEEMFRSYSETSV